MASDSAVERSTSDPVACLWNNYELTINMLEFARKVKPSIFYQVSTDEVYGEALPGQPSNPYVASKAVQEAVAISYWRSFDVPVVLTNTMNNVGEMQDSEKFLPKKKRCRSMATMSRVSALGIIYMQRTTQMPLCSSLKFL